MQYAADLTDPLVDVRAVLESFRMGQVTPPDWHQTLRAAVIALDRLPPEVQLDALLPNLLPRLNLLLARGLNSSPQVVDQVADQVAIVLQQTRIPGIPYPEDDDWGFGES